MMNATVILPAQKGIDVDELARQVREALPGAALVFVGGAHRTGGQDQTEYKMIQYPGAIICPVVLLRALDLRKTPT